LLLLLLQGYAMGLPGQFAGQQGCEGYLQEGQEEEYDEAKAEADAEGELWVHHSFSLLFGSRFCNGLWHVQIMELRDCKQLQASRDLRATCRRCRRRSMLKQMLMQKVRCRTL
jgi:hypothetical protein